MRCAPCPAVLGLVLAVGCSKSGTSGGGSGAPDWSGKPLVAQEVTLDGITFALQVPEGLPRDGRNPGDWSDARAEYDHVPKIFTSTIPIATVQSLDDAKRNAVLDPAKATWVREQARPTSWAITDARPDKRRVQATTFMQANDTTFIKCTAVQNATEPLPSYDQTRKMLETICDSVKAK